jgi:hypothetical protein
MIPCEIDDPAGDANLDAMQTRKLGPAGLEVSAIGPGCMTMSHG